MEKMRARMALGIKDIYSNADKTKSITDVLDTLQGAKRKLAKAGLNKLLIKNDTNKH